MRRDALELNMYYLAADPTQTSAQVEQMYLDLVRAVKASVCIPVAAKLNLSFSAFANMAQQLEQTGANGLVLFNRFYEPDFDLEILEVVSKIDLSNPDILLVRLRWIAILYGRIQAISRSPAVCTALQSTQGGDGGREGGNDDIRAPA